MNFLENLIHGKLTIHQEIINKFLDEIIENNKNIKTIHVNITGGFINLVVEVRAGEKYTVVVRIRLSLGGYEFNRYNRFLELFIHGPVIISIQGLIIKARLSLDTEPTGLIGLPDGIIDLLQYLTIKEDRITLDFNKIPGFNQLLQNKLGFMLKNLEVTQLEISEEMIIIHPTIKLF